MGSLKPGVTYIYERAGGIIYAREFGETKRRVVGYEADDGNISSSSKRLLFEMNEVVKMCETDPAMQAMLEQLFVMYNLKKTHE
jgi:predicted metal-dependent hydrolase